MLWKLSFYEIGIWGLVKAGGTDYISMTLESPGSWVCSLIVLKNYYNLKSFDFYIKMGFGSKDLILAFLGNLSKIWTD